MRPTTNTEREQMRLRSMTAAFRLAQVAVLHQSLDLTYDLVENLPDAWPAQDLIGRRDDDILPPNLANPLTTARNTALAENRTITIQLEMRRNMVRHIFEASVTPDTDSDGLVHGLTTTLTDITDRREREMATNVLLREVSHRSKNLLAIIQSVAMQTAQHNDGVDDFLLKFRGRLHAISTTQDLVTESNWRGTPFQSLALAQLARVSARAVESVRLVGDNPLLRPNAALHIGLAVHELAANSLAHAAPDAIVELSASLGVRDDQPFTLTLDWVESGTAALPSSDPRFGTKMLERIVPISVGGTATYKRSDNEVRYRLIVPATEFEA